MKAYIFETPLFCAVDVVIADGIVEAKRYLAEHQADNIGYQRSKALDNINKHIMRGAMTVTIKPLTKGFLVTGGGNG